MYYRKEIMCCMAIINEYYSDKILKIYNRFYMW